MSSIEKDKILDYHIMNESCLKIMIVFWNLIYIIDNFIKYDIYSTYAANCTKTHEDSVYLIEHKTNSKLDKRPIQRVQLICWFDKTTIRTL